ncbi:aminotransferase class III-fold pyridoxal phosphate-dependent enzyme [Sphingobacterium sp. DK4209]|uniref:Aminotransferase class III-fold pyridoxal phosphate-dependent enzyme n=1 Tax=Sphingobacterium zhuxiongii TaxID=2662364 RepID=A0A5Q0QGI2_9SPHI|nr:MULTISPECIES: aspartate aminotransferase family protein [unclassified Sphingobacterium]MVZ64700.1 aminotransferase class III-fold pyridoxal phosphate-dependent enzyme [Sphingobacterium sp. DK4209]QGA27038.1 aminotransferase class III-fold pyridoxal phosphate-dependent enzyme [Sphingobacterium sp. dk4302]
MNNFTESKKLLDRASKVLAGGVSSEFRKYNHPHAIFYKEGKGSRLIDVDGNEYLDFTLSQGPLILGHSHPRVLEAVNAYSDKGQLYAGQHIQEVLLAEKICELIPSAELIRFCLDGSEAVQTAFRVARAKTGKNKFLRFEGHYHGWLDNVAWGISTPSVEALGDRAEPTAHVWSQGVSPESRDEFIILPWNDLELLKETVKKHHHEIAAIITEPVMCNNGCIAPKAGFLEGIRSLCDEYSIAFILDEVITGFRLGLGGAQTHYQVTPDLSIFAKAMGSGYPISAIVGKTSWMDCISNSQVIHAGTMNSSNPTIAASLATITVLEEEQPYERMFYLGKKLMKGIEEAAATYNQNLKVFGLGPMFVTLFTDLDELVDYRDTLQSDKAKLGKFISTLQDHGIRVIGRGLWYISAVHTEADIDQAIIAVNEVLSEM